MKIKTVTMNEAYEPSEYVRMLIKVALDFGYPKSLVDCADDLMEAMRDYDYDILHESGQGFCILIKAGPSDPPHTTMTNRYEDPRCALLEALAIIKLGEKWDGENWKECV